MRVRILAFVAGIIIAHRLPILPAPEALAVAAPLALLMLRRRTRVLGCLLCGCLWALARASFALIPPLPVELEGETATIVGVVANIPVGTTTYRKFEFEIEELRSFKQRWTSLGRVQLTWYGRARQLQPGERWHFAVRLRRPYGLLNPGGHDREGHFYQRRIRALGYVVASHRNQRLQPASGWTIDGARMRLAAMLDETLAGSSHAGIVKALALGLRSDLDREQWRVFRRTGTAHLIAISGLHISLVAAFGVFIGGRCWSLSQRLTSKIPAPRVAAVAGLLAALAYAAMSGFAIPAQRAALMVTVVMVGLLSARRLVPSQLFLIALGVVTALDPPAVLAGSLWLSFLAVAFITYSLAGRTGKTPRWCQVIYVQLAVCVGLAPLLAFMFHEHAFIAPVANVIAVPWVSAVVVPLVLSGAFLSCVWPVVGSIFLHGADLALVLLWWLLERLSMLPFAVMDLAIVELWVLLTTVMAALIALMPRGLPGRWTALIWTLPLLFTDLSDPDTGEFWLTVLDVGQGLAVVVQTRSHTLLYDAGPRFGEHSDAGRLVVSPFLRHARIGRLDRVMISHGDNDHAGGADSVLQTVTSGELLSSSADVVGRLRGRSCRRGQRWRWDGVDFTVLHPAPNSRLSGNDRSCVLRISAPGGSALLPGDIEVGAERRLLERNAESLSADILVAPHHGSRISSTPPFIRAVQPGFVVFPIGRGNRFDFPHAEIVARYRRLNAALFATANSGAIEFKVQRQEIVVTEYRTAYRRFWHRASR